MTDTQKLNELLAATRIDVPGIVRAFALHGYRVGKERVKTATTAAVVRDAIERHVAALNALLEEAESVHRQTPKVLPDETDDWQLPRLSVSNAAQKQDA